MAAAQSYHITSSIVQQCICILFHTQIQAETSTKVTVIYFQALCIPLSKFTTPETLPIELS